MASLNKVLILGNLGADPEVSALPSGQTKVTMRVATNDSWNDKDGNRQERTEWHRVVVWGKQAENCKNYLKKGRTVFIEGRIQSRQWEDQQGQKRFMTEIVAQNVKFVGGGGGGPGRGQGEAEDAPLVEPVGTDAGAPPPIHDDDVPF